MTTWGQVFMLCGSVIGGIEGKGKGKDRDDETKEAAARCLWSLLRERTSQDTPPGLHGDRAQTRLVEFCTHSQTEQFIPIVGQTLNSLLGSALSPHLPLQRISLQVLRVLIALYAPESFVPSILPGVVSITTKIALGISGNKGWANGAIVALSLAVMQQVIVRSIGDDVCLKEGAVRSVVDLEDFAQFVKPPEMEIKSDELPRYFTARTSTWLRASTSQLHIALNTLTPLVTHPTIAALLGLCAFAETILASTSLTLPQSQPLLLSFLLSLSNSPFPKVSQTAQESFSNLLSPTNSNRHSLIQTLLHISKENISALPRLISSQADAKVDHAAGQIEAICRLSGSLSSTHKNVGLSSVSGGIDLLLGPTGGIEKWGWSLLAVLDFVSPAIAISKAPVAQLLLEDNSDGANRISFPEVTLKNVQSRSAYAALSRMFRALGSASSESSFYAVEWFISTGYKGHTSSAVAALWCAARLLEGIGNISLDHEGIADPSSQPRRKALEKFVRGLARDIAESWDDGHDEQSDNVPEEPKVDNDLHTEIIKGVNPIHATLQLIKPHSSSTPKPTTQPLLHQVLSLHLLSISAGILQARFTPLLIHVLYPILRSLVSPVSYISLTALATLNFITDYTSYASPANLLLSHFDYALDAVSRRLTHRWLDIEATKVLAVLVRLVGSDVVQKAGDVVEECFDRLDEFHGYEVIVEGLVEVLGEVLKVIEMDETLSQPTQGKPQPEGVIPTSSLQPLFEWVAHRKDPPEVDDTDYGPAPRGPWGENTVPEDETKEEDQPINAPSQPEASDDPPPTPTQALTKQIVSRSIYFLTHGSAVIRARILMLLSSATPVLPESALLPSIHQAWPFILKRLSDKEPFVVSATATLIESLASHVGDFMGRRIWDDVWPRFQSILKQLDKADAQNALARRGRSAVGTESAYTHSHRLYRSILKTMIAAVNGVHIQDNAIWQVILAFRRFLHSQVHEELQGYATELYISIGRNNWDAVWLALTATSGRLEGEMVFMKEEIWDIDRNVGVILSRE
ncbi:hypothetical protein SERLADRAFT_412501 [Serpula lacrymans var. lacrymans S7.9]|nr:uncharacterized protein SERLADRAFT_412501 [Serpula lacrymans var. lacrymans S7.9]EGO31018.1 hypothetical protein SERLADRAFT_412501 [Serpula lacrymans var. lacrymans S7.9]